ncbi:hypothetical protein DEO72_LG3g2893 [Vigna unguiculata]|uniref:Uncharacterized protein n=1 Tax=Vigna unguiculata TaxID=3917 RepID=A0A4D6LIL3_VIGUN|nr:hypothetical protein DEO72_LG3g2893 [Vigna unguiculata]
MPMPCQFNANHLISFTCEENNHRNALPRPVPRSGRRASFRREALTQASPPSPRRGLEKDAGAHAGSRLGETPLAWARCSLAQKSKLVA